MKGKSAFTTNLEKAHDNMRGPVEVAGGGVYTAAEAEKGRQRISKSLNRTMTASNNRHVSPNRSSVYVNGREGMPPNELGVTKATGLNAQRTQCIGQNEMADRVGFEYRVQEIMSMKNTGNVLNARVIETWINETLSDAEHLDIPGVILKPT